MHSAWGDLLYEPLELAPDKEAAIHDISRFGDFPELPGEKFDATRLSLDRDDAEADVV